MKKKIIIAFAFLAIAVSLFAVSASAQSFIPRKRTTTVVSSLPTQEEVSALVDTALKQCEMGMYGRGEAIDVVYALPTDGGYKIVFLSGNVSNINSVKNNDDGTVTVTFPAKNVHEWNSETGFYETTSSQQFVTLPSLIYYCNTSKFGYTGMNPNASYGTGNYNAATVNAYYSTIYNYVTGYESAVEDAAEQGRTEGKAECESTHAAIHDTAYSAGYSAGLSCGEELCESTHENMLTIAQNTGYNAGLIECSKTHDTIRQAGFDEGRDYGYDSGYDHGLLVCQLGHEEMEREVYLSALGDCAKTHESLKEGAFTDGRNLGYGEGYQAGISDAAKNDELELQIEYSRGRAEGYDIGYTEGYDTGYTEAINTGDVVNDYIDAIFSAPINFLYTMLDIEILGVNLFNIFMVVFSILIIGAVVLLVLKFR